MRGWGKWLVVVCVAASIVHACNSWRSRNGARRAGPKLGLQGLLARLRPRPLSVAPAQHSADSSEHAPAKEVQADLAKIEKLCAREMSDETCDLRWMRDFLYLFTMIPTTDYVLTKYFLEHYASLGVDLESKVLVVLHVIDPKSRDTMVKLLGTYNIGASSYKLATEYSSTIKRDYVNEWISTLPTGAWVIYPDGDELFEYPCDLRTYIEEKGIDRFWGRMADRVGPDLSLPELAPSPAIWQQYPMECPNYRQEIAGGEKLAKPYKFVLFKAHDKKHHHVKLRNSHTFKDDCEWCSRRSSNFLGCFAHYFFTGKATIQKLLYKLKAYTTHNSSQQSVYEKLHRHIAMRSTGTSFTREGREFAASVCRLAEPHSKKGKVL
mmetsp:Transcript_66069/g.158014  ORF Transcript_66069/g.158014 Transcript_66069/m.158014 type:complete len:379 (-) Transcript_66069:157-1293(-)